MSVWMLKISYRWRLLLLAIVAIIFLMQAWMLTSPQNSSIDVNAAILDSDTVKDDPAPPTPPSSHQQLSYQSKLRPIQFDFTSLPESSKRKAELKERQTAVKEAFLHGWNGYATYALGHDEVKPLTNKTHDPFGGWGASLVDSLSTMMVMGLDETMDAVIPEISKINFQLDENVSVFESIIRYLGGLLSAYELSDARHPILLQKAEELAQALLPAFDTASGLPYHLWNPVKKESLNNSTLIAEVGTVQLEFMVLSHHTRNPVYAQKAQKITDWLDKAGYRHGLNIVGLFPTDIDVHRGRFKDATCTFGAMGDSAFEYFLKEYLLAEGSVPQYGRLYLHSIDSMKRYMLRQLPGSELLFLPPFDTRHHTAKRTMDHLTCFVPGMLAMGAKTFDRPDDMVVAKGLLETCVYMYRSTATGLCSENWQFENDEPYNPLTYSKSREQLTASRDWWYMQGNSAQDTLVEHETSGNAHDQETVTQSYQLPPVSLPRPSGLQSMDRRYLLRPETVESIWILYRVTGDPKYQEYGWEIFQAIERWCKTPIAYAAVRNVEIASESSRSNQLDSMESFLFAETLKYLYLLFSPPDLISLDEYVLNTEAHPFRRKSLQEWQWQHIPVQS